MMAARVVGFVDHATAVTIEIERNGRTPEIEILAFSSSEEAQRKQKEIGSKAVMAFHCTTIR